MNAAVDSTRAFNRIFTQFVGALQLHVLGADMTPGDARLLFEIARGAHGFSPPATRLTRTDELGGGWRRRVRRPRCPSRMRVTAEVTTAFLRDFKPGREQCRVAKVRGVMADSIFIADEGEGHCRLRPLCVGPFARGLCIGDAVASECVGFGCGLGHEAMMLWSYAVLTSARRIYAGHGFEIVDVRTREEFGTMTLSETWRLDLRTPP